MSNGMRKTRRILALGLLLLALIGGCASTEVPMAGVRTITDAAGRQVMIPETVESIVCVGVGSLRFTSYMKATDLVVGVEQNEYDPSVAKLFSYVNRETFAALPATGDNGETYDEEIIKLAPDVIMASCDRETADALQAKLGIPVVAIPLVDSMFDESAYATLRLMGEVYSRAARAEALVGYIQGLEADLKRRTEGTPEAERPTVYVGGVNFKGARGLDGTEAGYAPLAAIGAVNLADQTGQNGAITIDPEQILAWNPDILLLDFSGMALIREDYAKNPDFYDALSAVKNGRVYAQIPFRFNAVNAEIALADAYYAGTVIYPEAFADVDPIAKADEIFEMMLGVKCYDTLRQAGYEFGPMAIGS